MKTSILLIIFCLLLTGCQIANSQAADGVTPAAPTIAPTMSTLPNPASVYCEQQGYTLQIRTAADGGQTGVCIFPDGSECDEWAYYRGECLPATTTTPTDAADYDNQGWAIYRDDALGYSFHYPANALLYIDDEPKQSLNITGPGMGSETWAVAHPDDRPEYRPPEDVDLFQWLIDHYLHG